MTSLLLNTIKDFVVILLQCGNVFPIFDLGDNNHAVLRSNVTTGEGVSVRTKFFIGL